MAIKFNETDAFYRVAHDATFVYPSGPWCTGFFYKLDDNTGNFYQFAFGNHTSGVVNGAVLVYVTEDGASQTNQRGKWSFWIQDDSGDKYETGTNPPTIAHGADNVWRLVILQRTVAGRFEFWTCPANGVAAKEADVAVPAGLDVCTGNILELGRRPDANADRYWGGELYRAFKGDFELTQAQIEQLASGTEIIDINPSTTRWYYRMESADASLTDDSGNGHTATQFGSPTTTASPAFGGPVNVNVAGQAQSATVSATVAVDMNAPTVHIDFDASTVDAALSSVDMSGAEPVVTLSPRKQTTTGDSDKFINVIARISNVNGTRPIIRYLTTGIHHGHSQVAAFSATRSYPPAGWTLFTNNTTVGSYREWQHDTAFAVDEIYVASMWMFSTTELETWITNNDANQYLHETQSSISYGGAKYQFNVTQAGDVDDIGRPVPQTPLYNFRISDDSQALADDGNPKRRVVIWSGLHAGEMVGTISAIGFMDYLLAAGDAVSQRLLRNFEFYCHPNVNAASRWAGHFRGSFETGAETLDTNREIFNNTLDVINKNRDALVADTGGTCHVGFDFHGFSGTLYQVFTDADTTAATKYKDALSVYTTFQDRGTAPSTSSSAYFGSDLQMQGDFANSPEIAQNAVTAYSQLKIWGEWHARVVDDLWLDNEFQIPVLIDVLAATANATCGCTVHVNRKSVRVNLVNASGTAQANLSNLKFALWDVATPDLIAAVPSAKGANGATDGSGDLQFYADSSTLMPGQVGSLWVTDSDGNPVNNANSHAHPVAMDQE